MHMGYVRFPVNHAVQDGQKTMQNATVAVSTGLQAVPLWRRIGLPPRAEADKEVSISSSTYCVAFPKNTRKAYAYLPGACAGS